jgi:hypothetical protein
MFLSVDGGRSRVYSSSTSKGGSHRSFLALMVDAPGSPVPAPPRGPPLMFHSVNGGRSRIYSSDTSQGARRRCFLSIDGGSSWVYNFGITQGAHCQHFLALTVDAPGSLALAPPTGPVVDVS